MQNPDYINPDLWTKFDVREYFGIQRRLFPAPRFTRLVKRNVTNKYLGHNHWQIQGALPVAPPQRDPILSFSHMFLPKSTHVGSWRPPTGNPGSATDNAERLSTLSYKSKVKCNLLLHHYVCKYWLFNRY